jgi:hypothetical protein
VGERITGVWRTGAGAVEMAEVRSERSELGRCWELEGWEHVRAQ